MKYRWYMVLITGLLIITGSSPIYGFETGNTIAIVQPDKRFGQMDMRNKNLYVLTNYSEGYHTLIVRTKDSDYNEELILNLTNISNKTSIQFHAIEVDRNGTIYFMIYDEETDEFQIWVMQQDYTVIRKIKLPNQADEDGIWRFSSFNIFNNYIILFRSIGPSAVWYDLDGNEVNSTELFPEGMHHQTGSPGERADLGAVETDKTGYWISSRVSNARLTDFQARFYHVERYTGVQDLVINKNPGYLVGMELLDDKLVYISETGIGSSRVEYTIYEIDLKLSRSTTSNAEFYMPILILIGLLICYNYNYRKYYFSFAREY